MQAELEEYLIDIVTGKRHNLLDKLVLILLSILEIIYLIIIRLRELFYRFNFFKSRKLNCKLISIGNITTGGTGKTPAVEKLARVLKNQGKRIVIINRGYGSDLKGSLIVSNGKEILTNVKKSGDEAYMLARHLPDIPIVAGKDRWQAGRLAEEKFNPEIILLDDGFQHWQLQRDLDVVIINALNPFGYFHLLPRGLLRESLSALKRVDLFIISKTDHVTQERIKEIKDRLRLYNKDAEIFTSRYRPLYLRSLSPQGDEIYPINDLLKNKKVLAFSGIGNPDSFVKGLEKMNIEVIEVITYPDHYQYKEEDLLKIAIQAQLNKVDMVITTEKDLVKLTEEMVAKFYKLGIKIFALNIELEILEDNRFLDSLIKLKGFK